jgi:nitroreductase
MTESKPDSENGNLAIIAERMRSRRTTKLFLKQKVSCKLVREAIEVARWAPNHHLTEPWHFYLMGPEKIAGAIELIGTLIEETRNDPDLCEFKRKSARAVPGWLLVTCRRSDDELRQREDYASVACAIQNLTLYLSEAGVASKWTTGLITRDPRFFELMDIDMDEEFVVGLIWFGYPKILPTQSRKSVEKILTETD